MGKGPEAMGRDNWRKIETERKISTVESDEDGEANAAANNYVLCLLSQKSELDAVIALIRNNSCINEYAAFSYLGVHGS